MNIHKGSLILPKDRPSLYTHGGDIYSLLMEGFKYEDIFDFSASINPLGPPPSVLEALRDAVEDIKYYPDTHARLLRKAIAEQHNIEPDTIIPGNGSTELIYLIARALRPKKVLIPVPTFSEYERACKCYGSSVMHYGLRKENNFDLDPENFISFLITHHSSQPFDMIFLCNPNNPTGRLIKKEGVLKIAEVCGKIKVYLVVDEAFIDFIPGKSAVESMIGSIKDNPYLIVLRSLTKFYSLAGLRIGYGVFPENILDAIKINKEPWSVNSLAQIAGINAIRDREYRMRTLEVIQKEKKFLEDGLDYLGMAYLPSSANFYLMRNDNAQRIISSLRDKGIIVRDCSNFAGLDQRYMRIAVRTNRENMRLLKELEKICQAL